MNCSMMYTALSFCACQLIESHTICSLRYCVLFMCNESVSLKQLISSVTLPALHKLSQKSATQQQPADSAYHNVQVVPSHSTSRFISRCLVFFALRFWNNVFPRVATISTIKTFYLRFICEINLEVFSLVLSWDWETDMRSQEWQDMLHCRGWCKLR